MSRAATALSTSPGNASCRRMVACERACSRAICSSKVAAFLPFVSKGSSPSSSASLRTRVCLPSSEYPTIRRYACAYLSIVITAVPQWPQ